MKIQVRVVLRSSRAAVQEENGVCKVHVTRPAQDGQANRQVIELLADHFRVKKYQVRILQGQASRNKSIEILTA